ncbi:MAG: hypothetical protein FJ098_05325, partial [Deltaproteobacteria bacterium]|nr:hypothetical protein [Deltaproteobacteria bacterium]
MKTRKPVSLVAVVLAVLVLGSCVGGGVSVNLDAVDSATDVTGGDAGIDTVGDAGDDLGLDTSAPDGAGDALDCGKLCQGSTCGVAGPAGECDCGDCDDGYACQEGTCVADCETLCGEQACGPAGLEGECDCGGCDEGYACQEGTCVADCEGLCGLLECGPAGLEGECDCGGCDDDNPCTDDSCEAGVCGHVGLDQVPCEDDDPCTSNGFCEAGTCVSEPMDCNDDNPCTDDVCNPESGMCEYPANAEDCDDGDVCTVGDHCKEAVCAGTPASCDCAADADCADLEDGDVCNGTLFCDLTQVPPQCELVPDSALTCPEPGGVDAPCLEAACDPETGDCGFAPAQDTYPCANEDLCTVGDTCAAGTCNDGVAANCNDGNPCTDDSCDPATGCLNTPNTTPCN